MRNLIIPFIILLTFVFSCRENETESLEQKNASYDVYISGKDNGDLCYWKNNVKHILNYNLPIGENPTKIFIDNNNVYVKGRYGFWKNGNYTTYKQELGTPFNVDIFDMYVKNGNLFLVGYTTINVGSSFLSEFCYWKNSVKNSLYTDTYTYNDQCTITEFNSDVYVGANKRENGVYKSGYFKNTTFHSLFSSLTLASMSTNVISDNDNVFFSTHEFYKNLNTNIQVNIPFLLPNGYYGTNEPTIDGNDFYNNANYDYFLKNGNFIYNPNSSKPLIKDLKVVDQNIYTIRHDPNNIEFKVYINNIETQSIQNLNFDSSFNNITVIKL